MNLFTSTVSLKDGISATPEKSTVGDTYNLCGRKTGGMDKNTFVCPIRGPMFRFILVYPLVFREVITNLFTSTVSLKNGIKVFF